MSWYEALILGLIQGLTEFLPVSSSGHLEIGQAIFGTASENNLSFTVTVHVATVMSTIVILWNEISFLFKGMFTKTWNPEKEYIAKIAISCIPIFIVGVFFKDEVESLFGNGLILVGCCLIITSLLLAFSYYAKAVSNATGEFGLDTSFAVTKTESGQTRVKDSFSKGTQKLYDFAIRLSFADSLYEGELPFLMLDDPFAYFDDEKISSALSLLKEISKTRQIIYFTATKSRA